MQQHDVVVVGAGSNSLVAAAYLAKAGRKVLVLEKNDVCGGGAISQEIAPGYIHDTHACGLVTCLGNPVLVNDELGLLARHGLELLPVESSFASLFDDGSSFFIYKDLDRTCEEVAKFSEKDAGAFRDFVIEARSLLPLLNRGAATPPLPTGRFISLLESNPLGRKLAEAMFASCYDIIDERFESEHVKIHFMKWCAEAMVNPEEKGTGILIYNLMGVACDIEPVYVKGGTGNLANALISVIEGFGGEVRVNSEVTRVRVSGGRATGVELDDGERVAAREAVIASIHPWKLGEYVPEVDGEIAAAARRTNLSHYGALLQGIALDTIPRFRAGDEVLKAQGVEFVPLGMEAMRRTFDEYRYGRIPQGHLSPMAIMPSLHDPTRAPEGCMTLWLYHFAPMVLAEGGLEGWRDHRQRFADDVWEVFKAGVTNIDDSNIVARHIECPLDHHNHSGSMIHGDIIGLATQIGQMLGRRPTPQLAQYAVPGIGGLYLAGPFMHPGGTVTLGGRATAIKMYQDMGIPLTTGFEGI